MATHDHYDLAGTPDIELATPRDRPVRYHLALPDGDSPHQRLAGLVLFIPGFGQDNDAGYVNQFIAWVADTFGFGCVSVQYHAHACRVSNGATRRFTQPDADRLVRSCLEHGAAVRDGDGPGVVLDALHKAYQAKAQAGQASDKLTLTCGLVAGGGERQNFGLMQALDHLYVLADLRQKIDYDRRNVIAIGSSHGGYLAHLIAKLAPNTIRAVFDNSGYATAPKRYINGREANLPDYIESYSPVMQMYFFLESMWSLNPSASNYFHDDARLIRSLMEPSHVAAMAEAGGGRTRYRCVHGPDDGIAPTTEKQACCELLSQAGFDVQYRCMGPSDVDGRYVKSLDHGMGLSLRGFFERSLATLPAQDLASGQGGAMGDDFDRATRLVYPGPKRAYRLRYSVSGVDATLS